MRLKKLERDEVKSQKSLERQELEREEPEQKELIREKLEREELERQELEHQELERQELEREELEFESKQLEARKAQLHQKRALLGGEAKPTTINTTGPEPSTGIAVATSPMVNTTVHYCHGCYNCNWTGYATTNPFGCTA